MLLIQRKFPITMQKKQGNQAVEWEDIINKFHNQSYTSIFFIN